MPFKKGHSGNPSGRPKGKSNQVTTDLRGLISKFLDKNMAQIQKDFDKMDPKDRLYFIEKLLKYAIPSLSSISATVDYERLPENQIDEIIERLLNYHNEAEAKD